MVLETAIGVLEHEVQVAGRGGRSAHTGLLDRRAAAIAGCSTQERLTVLVFDRLRAMLEADGYLLDTATVYAAVRRALSGTTSRSADRAAGAAADDAGFTSLASTAGPQALCAMFVGIGSICEELDLVRQALVAYRRALQYSLQTNDGVVIGDTRGRLMRLSTQHQRHVRAEARDVAADWE